MVYLVAARACLSFCSARRRTALFALLNMATFCAIWEWSPHAGLWKSLVHMAPYPAMVAVHFALMKRFARAPGKRSWIAFLFPIVILVLVKYLGPVWSGVARAAHVDPERVSFQLSLMFVGISFMAFRLSHMVLEVRSGALTMPTFWEVLGFGFFVPTIAVGPINPASVHFESLRNPAPDFTPIGRCLLRILTGTVKYLLFAGTLAHLAYRDLLLDGHPHAPGLDYVVSSVAYYLYLYCNFAGFCDIVIGASGLLGITVIENFDHPLIARNIKDFWSRWHISLSNYVREVIFAPLSSALGARWGGANVKHAIAVALLVTFILTGVWHGAGLNFAAFGLMHGLAIVAHHYYSLFLRSHLTRDRLRRYNESAIIRVVAVVATFAFVTLSFMVFANDMPHLKRIWELSAHLTELRAGDLN